MHGIIYNTTVTHAAENVVKEIRGMLMSTMNCFMFFGVFVGATLVSSVRYGYNGAFNSDRILGMFGLSFSMLSIFCTMFLTYESIPYLLRHGKESEAVVNMLKLRNESVFSTKLTSDLDELRLMVSQDKQDNQNIFSDGNTAATMKMIALRMLSILTNNFMLNVIMMVITVRILTPRYYHMTAVILTGTRFGMSFIPIITADFVRRKIHLTVSGLTSSVLLLTLAIIMASVNEFGAATFWIPPAMCILLQFFVSIGIDPIQHILLSEAFSTSKKAWSIAFVTSVEYLFQILLIGLFFIDGMSMYYLTMISVLFTTAGLMFALLLVLQLSIPETLNLSLKETRDLFRK